MTAPDDLAREEPTYRAYNEGFDRMVGVHEPECIGLNRDDDLAGQCDCRTIRMLVIGVLQERLASVVSRRDADLRTRIERLADEWEAFANTKPVGNIGCPGGPGDYAKSILYRVERLRAALDGDTREPCWRSECRNDCYYPDLCDSARSRVPADTDTGSGQ